MASVLRASAPIPTAGERPTVFADRLSKHHLSASDASDRRSLGQYFTPVPIADFMAAGCSVARARVRVLDPGAGTGVLVCALAEHLATQNPSLESVEITAFEIDGATADLLRLSLTYLSKWLKKRGIQARVEIRSDDFVLAASPQPTLFPEASVGVYDIAIANPPYFKLSKSDPRAQAMASIVDGQPNIYALFMLGAAQLLDEAGEFVAITPRSFCSGHYFAGFRRTFFDRVEPQAIHVFGSRRDAFSDADVLQENMIMWAHRPKQGASRRKKSVQLSASGGISDLGRSKRRRVDLTTVLRPDDESRSVWLPLTKRDDEVRRVVDSWSETLASLGLRVSTGPVVPFRAIPFLAETPGEKTTNLPLLWMQHVAPLEIRWPAAVSRKPQYVTFGAKAAGLLLPNANYVLLRRFSAKEERRRLIAAPILAEQFEAAWIGVENHLNYVCGSNLDAELAWGLAALLNSSLLDAYFRVVSGNTQVSATELRQTPLPSADLLRRIGAETMASPRQETADLVITAQFGVVLPKD